VVGLFGLYCNRWVSLDSTVCGGFICTVLCVVGFFGLNCVGRFDWNILLMWVYLDCSLCGWLVCTLRCFDLFGLYCLWCVCLNCTVCGRFIWTVYYLVG